MADTAGGITAGVIVPESDEARSGDRSGI